MAVAIFGEMPPLDRALRVKLWISLYHISLVNGGHISKDDSHDGLIGSPTVLDNFTIKTPGCPVVLPESERKLTVNYRDV